MNCPKCGTSPFQYGPLGLTATCHVCNTTWKVQS